MNAGACVVLFLTRSYGADSEKPRYSFKFASQISLRCAARFSYGKQTRTANEGQRKRDRRG